jgi:hypothetical protein
VQKVVVATELIIGLYEFLSCEDTILSVCRRRTEVGRTADIPAKWVVVLRSDVQLKPERVLHVRAA